MAYPTYQDNGGISAGTSIGTTDIDFPAIVNADDIIFAVVGDAWDDSFQQPFGPDLNSWTVNKNEFPDSSFEIGTHSWKTNTGSTISQSSDQANSGTYSLKVVTTTDVDGGAVTFDIQAPSSTQHTLSCYIYNTGTVNFDILMLDQDNNTISSITNQSSTQDNWVRHEVTGSTAGDDTGIRLKVRKSNDATATTFYVDDVQLEQAASATAYTDSVSTWTRIDEHTAHGNFSSAIFWMRADGTEDSKAQNWFSASGEGNTCGGIYFRFSGCVTTGTPFEDETPAGVTQSTSATISEITTLGADRLCCCFIGIENDVGTSGGTNYSEAADVTTTIGDNMGFSLFTYQQATADTVSSETATVGGTDYWTTYTLALIPTPPFPGPIYEGAGTIAAAGDDLVVVPWPDPVFEDDILLAIVGDADNDTFSTPGGWTPIESDSASNNFSYATFWHRVTAAEEASPPTDTTFTSASSSGSCVAGMMFRFSGCVTDESPIDDSDNKAVAQERIAYIISSGSGGPDVTTTGAERLIVVLGGVEDDYTFGDTEYFTLSGEDLTNVGSDMSFACWTYQMASAGRVYDVTGNESYDLGSDEYQGSVGIALKPAEAAGTDVTINTVEALTIAGYDPTIKVDVAFTMNSAGAVAVAGYDPTIKVDQGLDPTLGTVAVVGYDPTVLAPTGVVVGSVGAVAIAGYDPAIEVEVSFTTVAPGALVVAGYDPTIKLNKPVSATLGAVAIAGYDPTILAATGVNATSGVIAIAGYDPTIKLNKPVSATLGTVAITGYNPTLGVDDAIFPGAGAVTIAGYDPTILAATGVAATLGAVAITGYNVIIGLAANVGWEIGAYIYAGSGINIGLGTVVIAGYDPTILVNEAITATLGTVAIAGYDPAVYVAEGLQPGFGTVAIAGYNPTINAGLVAAAGVGAVAITGYDPMVTAGLLITAGTGAVAIAGYNPTVATGVSVLPGTGAVAIAGYDPTIKTDITFTVGNVGALAIAGYDPTIKVDEGILPGVGAIAIAGYNPTLQTNKEVTAGTGAVVIAGYGADINVMTGVDAGLGAVAIAGYDPAINVEVSFTTGAVGALAIAGYDPTVTAATSASPGVGLVAIEGFNPTIYVGGEGDVLPTDYSFFETLRVFQRSRRRGR